METNLFVNLPVKDLKRSMDFFGQLGFSFNQQFTNEKGACLVISTTVNVMLLTEPFFRGISKKEIPNTSSGSQVILAISLESKSAVDEMMSRALAAGATTPMDDNDHGFMYQRGFADLDGHLWEVFWMDPATINQEQPEPASS